MLDETSLMTFPPLASADMQTGQWDRVHDIVPHFVRAIRQNRDRGPLDRIVCRNGRCVYECVWVEADNGSRFCVYALDLYGWVELGDVERFGRRGCVGAYDPPDRQAPASALLRDRGDDLELRNPLDPFPPPDDVPPAAEG